MATSTESGIPELTDMGKFDGQVVIVTGASQGIGAVLAHGFAREGARVAILDVLDTRAIVAGISEEGGQALGLHCDVSDEAAVAAAVREVVDALGPVSVLVNNAALFGTLKNVGMFDIEVEHWDRVMAINARGCWLMMRAVAPHMPADGSAAIVNVATNRVFQGAPDLLHYDASKGAVVAMTRSAARELGSRRIRANCIAPGLTMSENVLKREGIADRAPRIAAGRALARDQQPGDLLGAVLFLSSADAGFITGQCLVVDGGGVMR